MKTNNLLIENAWLKNSVNVNSELNLYHYLIQIYCIFEEKQISLSERSLLAYYMRWGISKETENQYKEDFNRIGQVVSNIKSALVGHKMLIKTGKRRWSLPPQFSQRWPESLSVVLEFNVTK